MSPQLYLSKAKVLKAIDPYSFFSRNAKAEQIYAIPGLCCFIVRDLSCLLATLVTISSTWIQVCIVAGSAKPRLSSIAIH
jgi:hypothetical protein